MATIELRNQSDNEFTDISSERYRMYNYSDKSSIIINHPQFLSVSKSGGHRIIDLNEVCHYIQPGWQEIVWEVHKSKPHFVK